MNFYEKLWLVNLCPSGAYKDPYVQKRDTSIPMKNMSHLLATRDELAMAGYPRLCQQNFIGIENHIADSSWRCAPRKTEADMTPNFNDIVTIDCEMVQTTKDPSALARLSAVGIKGEVLFDMYVKPPDPVTDYKTRFSGITAAHLRDEASVCTLADAQTKLLKHVGPRTILCGHSLENDLKALKIAHPFVIDTALLFPHLTGLPNKRSLSKIALDLLDNAKQLLDRDSSGHCSIRDARCTWELVKRRLEWLASTAEGAYRIVPRRHDGLTESEERAVQRRDVFRGLGGLPNISTALFAAPDAVSALNYGYCTQFPGDFMKGVEVVEMDGSDCCVGDLSPGVQGAPSPSNQSDSSIMHIGGGGGGSMIQSSKHSNGSFGNFGNPDTSLFEISAGPSAGAGGGSSCLPSAGGGSNVDYDSAIVKKAISLDKEPGKGSAGPGLPRRHLRIVELRRAENTEGTDSVLQLSRLDMELQQLVEQSTPPRPNSSEVFVFISSGNARTYNKVVLGSLENSTRGQKYREKIDPLLYQCDSSGFAAFCVR